MKYFKLTYYLLFICIVAASCSTDTNEIVNPDQTNEEVKVQLTIRFPETATRVTTDPGTAEERNIDNVHLYVFEANGASFRLKEEAKVVAIDKADKNGNRTINGVLFEKYSQNIKLVALTNLNTKGFDFGNLPGKGTEISDFYKELVFSRTNNTDQWPFSNEYKLPMWGECEMNTPQGGTNSASLNLTRAIAKVNVLVNDGQGIANQEFFKITKIEVCQYNDHGYCTPGNYSDEPNVPASAKREGASLIYENTPSYTCKDRIYIPEQKNIGVTDNKQKVFLNLTATINRAGKTKEFRINFKKDGVGADFDVLRNNVYVFNIQSVQIEEEKIVSVSLSYKVVEWGNINIVVPPFGNE